MRDHDQVANPNTPSNPLRTDYEAAGLQGRLGFGRNPALIVVDMAQAYFQPGSPLFAGVPHVLDATLRIVASARAAGVPVIFSEVRYQPGGVDGGVFYRKVAALRCFEAGNPLQQLQEPLSIAPGDIRIVKQYASAFFGTSLASTLTALGVDSLIITGVSTSGCVRATALDACQHGFIPLVVREAVGDRNKQVHEANLFDLNAKYADVVSEDETLAHLSSLGKLTA
jgi:maleamate amidohydrolase